MINSITIWQPRYSRNDVLVACFRVKPGMNRIIFTRTTYPDLYMDGAEMKKYPVDSNGKVACYAVPIKDFARSVGQLTFV